MMQKGENQRTLKLRTNENKIYIVIENLIRGGVRIEFDFTLVEKFNFFA